MPFVTEAIFQKLPIKNKEKALKHFEKLLSMKPGHPRAQEIQRIIDDEEKHIKITENLITVVKSFYVAEYQK